MEKRAKDVLQEVLSLRNSLRPVNHLPPEVLSSCATFVSDNDPRPIISLTHVCRYWRKAISSDPRNWASIATGWKRLAPLCLERAGTVLLALDITVSDIERGDGFLETLVTHTSKINTLRLVGYSSIEAVENALPGFFRSRTPNLTSLELEQRREPVDLFPSNEAPVPSVFRNVSRLESLRLTQTPIYPPLYGIASLRELKLTGYTKQFHFETFIGFLASNPSLEMATLGIGFVEGSVWVVPLRVISLSRLRHLSFTYVKPLDAKGLLSSINFSRGLHLEIVFPGVDQPNLLQSSLPYPLAPFHEALTPITVVKVQNSPKELHLLCCDGSFSFRTFHFATWCPELHLFSATSVRELRVNNGQLSLVRAFLDPLLMRVPALETLVFTNTQSWATGIFDTLGNHPLLWPFLKTIAFFNCTLTPQVIQELEDVLTKRKGSEATWVYRVVIVSGVGAFPDHTLIRRLRQQVPCVDVSVADELPDLS